MAPRGTRRHGSAPRMLRSVRRPGCIQDGRQPGARGRGRKPSQLGSHKPRVAQQQAQAGHCTTRGRRSPNRGGQLVQEVAPVVAGGARPCIQHLRRSRRAACSLRCGAVQGPRQRHAVAWPPAWPSMALGRRPKAPCHKAQAPPGPYLVVRALHQPLLQLHHLPLSKHVMFQVLRQARVRGRGRHRCTGPASQAPWLHSACTRARCPPCSPPPAGPRCHAMLPRP